MTSTMQSTNNIRLRVRVWGRTFRLPVPTHASFADLSQLLAKRLELPPTAAFQFAADDGDQLSAVDQITDVVEEDETLTARAAPPSKASVPPDELELITVPVVLGGSAPAADEATTTLSETVDGWVVIQTRSKPDSTSTAQPVEHGRTRPQKKEITEESREPEPHVECTDCPLCLEKMDVTDKAFFPCTQCHYQVLPQFSGLHQPMSLSQLIHKSPAAPLSLMDSIYCSFVRSSRCL